MKKINTSSVNTGRMIKHSSIYATGNIIRQLVGFIMLPIYTRYLSPADYGVIGLLIFSLSLVDILFGARLSQAIPKFYHAEKDVLKRKTIISSALILTSAISLVTMCLIVLNSDSSSSLVFGNTEYGLIISIYSILILTQAIENYGLLYIRIKQKPYFFLLLNVSKLVVQLSCNIWFLIYLDMGVLGIAISAAITSILLSTFLLTYTFYHTQIRWDNLIAKKLFIFSWPLWIAGFAGLYIGSANRYYMRIFGSLDDIGLYELAAKFSSIIIFLIWKPINQYWQTEKYRHYEKGKPAPEIYRSVFLSISTIIIISGLGIAIFSEPMIMIMATDSYYDSIKIVPILVLGSILFCFTQYFNFSQMVTDNTKWISANNYITAVIATIMFLIFIPYYGHVGAALASLITILFQLILTVNASKKHYDMMIEFKPIIYMLLISTISYYFSNILFSNNSLLLSLLVKGVIYIISTCIILWIMWFFSKNKEYILSLIQKLKLT